MSLKSFFKDSRQAKTHPTSVKSRQQMTCSLSFTSKSFLMGATWWSNFDKLCMLEIFLSQNIMVFVACRNSTCFQKLNIIVYFLTCSYSISFLKMCDNTFENMRSRDIQIRKCEWSHGCKMSQTKLPIKNS